MPQKCSLKLILSGNEALQFFLPSQRWERKILRCIFLKINAHFLVTHRLVMSTKLNIGFSNQKGLTKITLSTLPFSWLFLPRDLPQKYSKNATLAPPNRWVLEIGKRTWCASTITYAFVSSWDLTRSLKKTCETEQRWISFPAVGKRPTDRPGGCHVTLTH